ncbi:hypothetical protein QUA70_27600 [Microcoleus sp. LAD1_D5]
MIGKQIKGTGFRGCLNYVLGKKDAALIGGTMCGQTPEELAAEFGIARQLRPNLKVAVFHATLSVDHTEKLEDSEENDQRWLAISVFVSDSGANNAVREEVIAKVAKAAWDEWSK